MRKPRDITAELASLHAKEAALRAARKQQLADLLERTGADRLEPELLAGALLSLVEAVRNDADGPARATWRQRGATFFRPRRRARGDSAPPPLPGEPDGADPPAAGAEPDAGAASA